MNAFRTNSLIALMTLFGLGIFSYLSFMLMNYPLFDFAVNTILCLGISLDLLIEQ